MIPRKPIDSFAIISMIILCMIWGLQQVSIKFILVDVAPVLQGAIRSIIATIAIYIVIRVKKTPLALSRSVYKYGALAGLLFGLEFLFVNEGLRYTTASHISVFTYTSPIFAALGMGWLLPEERLSVRQWLGIAICVMGIAIAFLYGGSGFNSTTLRGDLYGLLAGVSLGATTVVIRSTPLGYAPATHVLYFQVLGASIMLSLYALLTKQYHFTLSGFVIANILFQGLVVSFASFLMWFFLIKRYYVSQVGNLGFLTPIFGVVFSILLLNEKLSSSFMVGSLCVIFGVVFISLSRAKNIKAV